MSNTDETSGSGEYDASFEALRQELLGGGIPIPHLPKGDSLSHPAGPGTEGPAIVGELHPDTVEIGRQGSSLLGALAIAIRAARHEAGADELFKALTDRRTDTPARIDSPKRLADTLRSVSSFRLGILKTVSIRPLMPVQARFSEGEPLPRVFNALQEGSAIVLPINLNAGAPTKRRSGRVVWGAITGYREELVTSQTFPLDSLNSRDPERNSVSVRAHFAVVLAVRNMRTIASLKDESLDSQLGDGRSACVVSRIEDEPLRSEV